MFKKFLGRLDEILSVIRQARSDADVLQNELKDINANLTALLEVMERNEKKKKYDDYRDKDGRLGRKLGG